MISFPNAKINIGLNILRRRKDGFHDIESLFYPINLCDVLEIVISDKLSFTSSGVEIPGNHSDNLCLKAYRLIQKRHRISPVKIHLHKIIPMGAGLGGGSSDAAFCLKMLNEIFELKLSESTLEQYALELGSDCPFFIRNKPAIAYGRGEILKTVNIDLSLSYLVLVNPGVHVGTGKAYQNATIKLPETEVEQALKLDITEWKNVLVNGFEPSVFTEYPQVQDIKSKMYERGAVYASMTGSGSSVFGIFDDVIDIENDFPGYFTWSKRLGEKLI